MANALAAAQLVALALAGFPAGPASAELVPVRHVEARMRGFLVVRDAEGKAIGIGQLNQYARGDRVIAELRIHLNDGSIHDETTEFSQRRSFRLRSYRLVQKGPAFKRQLDMAFAVASGEVTIRYSDKGEPEKVLRERLDLPDDLANGMLPTLLNDIDRGRPKTVVSMLAATPKPRVVKLEISPEADDSFSIAGSPLTAHRFKAHVEIGGIAGAIAPVIGRQPPDSHVWMVGGKAPSFLKSEGPLFEGGPIWTIAVASPVWGNDGTGGKPDTR